MKLLFKLYLLGQLIALPFMVGAIGDVLNTGNDSSAIQQPQPSQLVESAASVSTLSRSELCDALHGEALNPVQDNLQQLSLVIDQQFEGGTHDCFGDPAR